MFGECHGHIILDGVNYADAVALHDDHVKAAIIHNHFAQYQNCDITFFRDGGDNRGVSKRAVDIAPEYGIDYRTPIYALHKFGNYGDIVGFGFSDMKQFRKRLEDVSAQGADFVKIMASGIIDFNQFGSISEGVLTFKELKEIIHIIHQEGFSVMVHVNGSETITNAIEAGADSIEHGFYMDDDTIATLAHSSCVWVPTVSTVANLLDDPNQRFDQETVHKIVQLHSENILKAIEKGAHIALGSDAGAYLVPHCKGTKDEYAYLSKIVSDINLLHNVLTEGENVIKHKFRRNHG